LAALLEFLCHTSILQDIPEMYDCITMALQLVLVLLATQLYQPLQSSFQRQQQHPSKAQPPRNDYFWRLLLEPPSTTQCNKKWSPRTLLTVLLEWHTQRPPAPAKSIQYHSNEIAAQVVAAKGEKRSADGLYESHWVVQAEAPMISPEPHAAASSANEPQPLLRRTSSSSKAILDATRGALVLSSQIILLPFRLMSLALQLWGHHLHPGQHQQLGYDASLKQHLLLARQQQQKHRSRTQDVLWLTQSPVADLSTSLLLLLSNTERVASTSNHDKQNTTNAFRRELAALADNRWEHELLLDLPDLPPSDPMNGNNSSLDLSSWNIDSNHRGPTTEGVPLLSPTEQQQQVNHRKDSISTSSEAVVLTVNFEALFESFGTTAHTEPGALLLYTLLQSSPTFAASLAVRSDLDTLVLPLLRTLYFATALRHHVAQDYQPHHRGSTSSTNGHRRTSEASVSSASSLTAASLRDCPFRSVSQLYVIIILLLLFSQDSSFGADAFRRVMVPTVPWYKERYLREISLGSVLVLALLRCLSFNLNRQNDAFLLSNCCAVLMNLSSSIVDLHDYAAMRLTALAVLSIKRYLQLRQENPDNDEDDLTTPTSMHGEAARTLLCTLKHCVSAKNIEKNLHVVYALLYHQADFKRLFASAASKTKGGPPPAFKKSEIQRIQTVMATAAQIIDQDGSARTAPKALKILTDHIDEVKEAVTDDRRSNRRASVEPEDFTFTYEEEADPEIFFVPYVWEVIVCVVTSTSIEWNKNRIQVFPLLEEEEESDDEEDNNDLANSDGSPSELSSIIPQFARDVNDVV